MIMTAEATTAEAMVTDAKFTDDTGVSHTPVLLPFISERAISRCGSRHRFAYK
jgi:hypothetical protein